MTKLISGKCLDEAEFHAWVIGVIGDRDDGINISPLIQYISSIC